MIEIANLINQTFVYALTFAFAFAAAWFINRVQHKDWTTFEPRYAAKDLPPPLVAEKAGAVRIALIGEDSVYPTTKTKWNGFISVTVGLYPNGLSLSIMPLFRFGSKDLFLPFAGMQVGTVKWLGWTDHYGLLMPGIEHFEIVIPRKTMQKLAARSDLLSALVDQAEPSKVRIA